MNVLMIGVDKTSVGGMLTVVENYLNDKEFCDKIHLRYIATVIRGKKTTKILTFLKKIPEIIHTVKKYHIDIVHVHMAERGSVFREGFVIWMAKHMGCKTVIHMHGANIEKWYNAQPALIKKITAQIFCSADRMIVLGENWKPFMEQVMKGHEDKIEVLHNAVRVELHNMANPNAKNILFYGMLIQRKGIDDLLQAFSIVSKRLPEDITLTLYGDDTDADEPIEKKLLKYNLPDRIRYCGWLTEENRRKIFSDTLINVLPSYNEGLPMTILESMAYGIPNISTNIAAIPEAIQDGVNGFTICPGNVADLADKMYLLCTNKELWKNYSDAAYKRAKEEFSIQRHFEKLIGIYQTLLQEP